MKHPLTWWQRNCVQGRTEVVIFVILSVFVVGVLVLWATKGRAEGWSTSSFYCTVNGRFAPCPEQIPEGAWIHLRPPQTACEQKMEEAMRAMDSFRAVEITSRSKDNDLYVISYSGKNVNELKRAIAQWESVKLDCWRRP